MKLSRDEELALELLGAAALGTFGYLWWKCDFKRWSDPNNTPSDADVANMNRFQVRGYVIVAAILTWGPKVSVAKCRAAMLVVWNESHGSDSNIVGDQDQNYPSIGLMQVNGSTAISLGLVSSSTTPDQYLAKAGQRFLNIWRGMKVLKNKIDAAGGDDAEGVLAYNGSADYLAAAQSEDASVYQDQLA